MPTANLLGGTGIDEILTRTDAGGTPGRDLSEVIKGDPAFNGLAACKTLKDRLKSVPIMVWSNFEHARPYAVRAGATHFEDRTMSFAMLLRTIRAVAHNRAIGPRPDRGWALGRIERLRLATRDRRLTVEDALGMTRNVQLTNVGFAIVWYLALERQAQQTGWFEPTRPAGSKRLVYRIKKPDLWRHIRARTDVSTYETEIPNVILNNWVTKVAQRLNTVPRALFDRPVGRPTTLPTNCSLIADILFTAIHIQDDPESVNLAMHP